MLWVGESFLDSEMTGAGEYGLTGQGSFVGGASWSFLKESRVQRGQVARSGGPCGLDVGPWGRGASLSQGSLPRAGLTQGSPHPTPSFVGPGNPPSPALPELISSLDTDPRKTTLSARLTCECLIRSEMAVFQGNGM